MGASQPLSAAPIAPDIRKSARQAAIAAESVLVSPTSKKRAAPKKKASSISVDSSTLPAFSHSQLAGDGEELELQALLQSTRAALGGGDSGGEANAPRSSSRVETGAFATGPAQESWGDRPPDLQDASDSDSEQKDVAENIAAAMAGLACAAKAPAIMADFPSSVIVLGEASTAFSRQLSGLAILLASPRVHTCEA